MDTPFNDEDDGVLEQGVLAGVAGAVAATQGVRSSPSSLGSLPIETSSSSDSVIDERSSIITARGTSDGLVLRIDGRVQPSDLSVAVREFLTSRRSFLSGNDVAFEWVGRKPEDAMIQELTEILSAEFEISVRSSKLKVNSPKTAAQATESFVGGDGSAVNPLSVVQGSRAAQGVQKGPSLEMISDKSPDKSFERPVSLFDGMEGYDSRTSGTNSMLWDDPDARVVYGTLRSGQKVETEHSVIIFGDINSGAEVIAGGDIVILGTLRGIAHAGAYDESGGGRVIFSLNMQPTQLRIGLVISRGGGADKSDATRGASSEIARVDNNTIVVEPYQSRTVWVRRRE
jgi:septum formation inhibitor MinC